MSKQKNDEIEDSNNRDIALTSTINFGSDLGMQLSPEIMVRLSYHHLKSAYYFAKSSYDIEKSGNTKDFDADRSYVIGCIVTSVSYLEAKINEYFSEIFKDMWNYQEEKGILDKYKICLLLADKKPFDEGREPFQSVSTLIKVRNYTG